MQGSTPTVLPYGAKMSKVMEVSPSMMELIRRLMEEPEDGECIVLKLQEYPHFVTHLDNMLQLLVKMGTFRHVTISAMRGYVKVWTK